MEMGVVDQVLGSSRILLHPYLLSIAGFLVLSLGLNLPTLGVAAFLSCTRNSLGKDIAMRLGATNIRL